MQSIRSIHFGDVRLPLAAVDPHVPVGQPSRETGKAELRDEIEAWVNEGGAGDDVEP